MTNLGDEFSRWGGVFVAWIPHLVGAIIAFVIGWLIALILKYIITAILKGLGLNRKIERSKAEGIIHRLTNDPASAIGNFIYWLVMIITILVAVDYLQIPVLTDLVARIYNFIPNIIGAIFILLVALAISGAVTTLIMRWMGETVTGKVIASVIPIVILSISGFAILEQLGVAPIIISTTYIALMGSVALAAAIALGLGGKDIANRILESGYKKGSENLEQIRRDVKTGTKRAKAETKEFVAEDEEE